MKKIIDYRIVTSTIDRVLDEVFRLISEGWQPLGGVSATYEVSVRIFTQSMVKYEEETRYHIDPSVPCEIPEGAKIEKIKT